VAAAIGTLTGLTVVLSTLRADHYDDAFISYVFARNLANGHGITWVAGDAPLYGSTSLLYTVLLALAGRLGWDIPFASGLLGALAWAAAAALLFPLLQRWSLAAALGGALLFALWPLAASLSMGMESGLYTALALLALLLQAEGRPRGAACTAALATLTRPEGLLLLLVLFGDGVRGTVARDTRARLKQAARPLLPGALLLALALSLEAAYFGTVIPEPVVAKAGFGCDVAGCFSPWAFAGLLAVRVGRPVALLLLAGASLGLVRAAPSAAGRGQLLLVWSAVHAGALLAARAPDAPWYYAPLVPAVLAAYAHGLAAPAPRWRSLALAGRIALIATLAIAAVSTSWRIVRDPLGANVEWNLEKRQLAAVVLDDMTRRGKATANLLAFEVGYVGWAVPGRVYDMLGLVTPGLQPCLQGRDPAATLLSLDPDYVLVIDDGSHRATSCVYQAALRSPRLRPLLRMPRRWGHDYVVFARRERAG
jgi:hypothetical protein